ILKRREIPLLEPRPLQDVTAFVAELAGLRCGIELLEGCRIEPFLRSPRTAVRVAHDIGAIAGEAGDFRSAALERDVIVVINREGRSGHEGSYAVQLPIAKGVLIPGLRMVPEREFPLIANHEAMPSVEHGATMFSGEVKGILRQIVFARDALRCRAGDVEGRDVIESLGESVRGQKGKTVAKTLFEAGLQRVVGGVSDAGDQADRGEIARWAGGRKIAAGIEAPIVHVVFRGVGLTAGLAGNEDGGIAFDEARKLGAFGADKADFKKPIAGERAL